MQPRQRYALIRWDKRTSVRLSREVFDEDNARARLSRSDFKDFQEALRLFALETGASYVTLSDTHLTYRQIVKVER